MGKAAAIAKVLELKLADLFGFGNVRRPGDKRFSPAWLTRVLVRSGNIKPGVEVTSIKVKPLGVGLGFTSNLNRLELEFNTDDPGFPKYMAAKNNAKSSSTRILAKVTGMYKTECMFYKNMTNKLCRSPKCYYVRYDNKTSNFLLLFEFYESGTLIPGDAVNFNCTLSSAIKVVRFLACFHAKYWGKTKSLKAQTWIQSAADLDIVRGVFRGSWNKAKKTIRPGIDLPEEAFILADCLCDFIPELQLIESEPPLTIVHGDCKIDNMFFPGPMSLDGKMAFCDFQMIRKGVGATDLMYLMGKNFSTEFRRANEEALLGAYLDELYLNGVNPEAYNMEKLRYHYTRGVFYVFMIYIVSEAELGGGPPPDVDQDKGKSEGPEEEDDRGEQWSKMSKSRTIDLVLEKRAKTLLASILEDTLYCVPEGKRRRIRTGLIEKLDAVGRPGRFKIPKSCRVMPPEARSKYRNHPSTAPPGPQQEHAAELPGSPTRQSASFFDANAPQNEYRPEMALSPIAHTPRTNNLSASLLPRSSPYTSARGMAGWLRVWDPDFGRWGKNYYFSLNRRTRELFYYPNSRMTSESGMLVLKNVSFVRSKENFGGDQLQHIFQVGIVVQSSDMFFDEYASKYDPDLGGSPFMLTHTFLAPSGEERASWVEMMSFFVKGAPIGGNHPQSPRGNVSRIHISPSSRYRASREYKHGAH